MFHVEQFIMPCYHPLTIPHPKLGIPITVACGQCIGCRLERSRQWATRILHETKCHEESSFITLTYNDVHLPKGGTLVKRDVQLFIKKLRKKLHPHKISYFHCGEYGGQTARPHYHIILFGYDFPDKELYRITETGDRLYTSRELESLWGLGFCPIGSVTFESAAYVARYCVDKLTGDAGKELYEKTGRIPPYVTMSTKPAIGKRFLEEFFSDVYPHDEVITRGISCKPPQYYDRILEKKSPELFKEIKKLRKQHAESNADANDFKRLRTKEAVKNAQIKIIKNSRNKV